VNEGPGTIRALLADLSYGYQKDGCSVSLLENSSTIPPRNICRGPPPPFGPRPVLILLLPKLVCSWGLDGAPSARPSHPPPYPLFALICVGVQQSQPSPANDSVKPKVSTPQKRPSLDPTRPLDSTRKTSAAPKALTCLSREAPHDPSDQRPFAPVGILLNSLPPLPPPARPAPRLRPTSNSSTITHTRHVRK
jgi:hypothetical protein